MKKLKWYWWVLIIAIIIIIIVIVVRNNKNKSQGALASGAKQSTIKAIRNALVLQQQQADVDLLNKVNICISNIPDSDISAYYPGVSEEDYARRLLAKCSITSAQVERVMILIQ